VAPQWVATLEWFEGVAGAEVSKGRFIITRIAPVLFPAQCTIVATAAPFQVDDKTEFKKRRTVSHKNTNLAQLFKTLVEQHGFEARFDSFFESIAIDHVDQSSETDAGFLTRLARQHDAIAKPVDKIYVLARRGQIKTISGRDLPVITLSLPTDNHPGKTAFINCLYDQPSRHVLHGVKAQWTDDDGEERTVEAGQAPFKQLRHQNYSSASAALTACENELRRIKRVGSTLVIDMPGDPLVVAEGVLTLDDTFPEAFSGTWSIDQVDAKGDTKNGYRLKVKATRPII